jgi:hypothetical protein
VFDMNKPGNLLKVVVGESIGTLVEFWFVLFSQKNVQRWQKK